MKPKLLQDRVAVITGGSRGIGKEIALSFAREGCGVVLIARDRKALESTAAFIRQGTGGQAAVFPLDITERESVETMVHDVTARFGRIDVLVNAAAIVEPIGPFHACDAGEWERTITVNLFGTYRVSRAVIPVMIERKYGTILNFSGGGAFGARPRFSAYSVSKAGVARLTDAMALELREFGIAVNCISPGQVNTDMFDAMVAAGPEKVGTQGWAEFQKRKESGGDPIEDVGRLALFLVSEEGRKITGRMISVRWDPWEHFPNYTDELMKSDIYTMRRIKPEDYGKNWQ